jgi:uncharacterized protein (DUF433 family)
MLLSAIDFRGILNRREGLLQRGKKMTVEIQPTEHPHIVRHPGIGGGEPIIKGTRIAVRLVAGYYKRGAAVEEIERDYAFLSAAAIHDAISYYLDHQAEIEELIAAHEIETVLRKTGLTMDERGVIDLTKTSAKV